MNEKRKCPACGCVECKFEDGKYICPDCGYEWADDDPLQKKLL